jgi:hypothetical protein
MSTELTVEKARALLASASELQMRREREQVVTARRVLDAARKAFYDHTDTLLAQASSALARYEGLPEPANLLSIIGRERHELSLAAILAWLLSPKGDHGLGDAMLRRLLARSNESLGVKLATQDQPLRASVATEVPIKDGRIDIFVALPGVVLFVEVKVEAREHAAQTEYYRTWLGCSDCRRQALQRLDGGERQVGSSPHILGFYLRKRGRERCTDQQSANIDWLEVEEDLASCERRAQLMPSARAAIRTFRTTLLQSGAATVAPMENITRLRRLVDVPVATRLDPLNTALKLRSLLGTFEERQSDAK